MEKYFFILSQSPLFHGIGQEDLKAMMACLGGKFIAVPKGDPVFLEGDPAQLVGVVLSGGVVQRFLALGGFSRSKKEKR